MGPEDLKCVEEMLCLKKGASEWHYGKTCDCQCCVGITNSNTTCNKHHSTVYFILQTFCTWKHIQMFHSLAYTNTVLY